MKLFQILILVYIQQIQMAFADTSIPPVASFGASSITALQASGEVKIPVTMSGAPLVDFFGTTVRCTSVEGTATWPYYYDSVFTSVKFLTGETSKTLIIGLPTAPAFEGTKTFTVRMNNSSEYNLGTPSTITVNITGSYVPPPPEIVVRNPAGDQLANGTASVSLGAIAINSKSGPKTFVIQNTGAGLLTGLTIMKSGSHASMFTVVAPTVASLAQGIFTTFTVNFSPTAVGPATASISIASNDADENPFNITLEGVGVPVPEIAVEQLNGSDLSDNGAVVSCGAAIVGTIGETKTFRIRNSGSADLTGIVLSKIGAHPGDFGISAPAIINLAPGDHFDFSIIFSPSGAGTRSATIQIASNDSDENPFDVRLTASGIALAPEIAVDSPTETDLVDNWGGALEWGAVTVGQSTETKTFMIRNSGNQDLTGISISSSGIHAGDVVLISPAAPTVVPGGSTSFSVVLRPTGQGQRLARLHIASNDSDENPFDIPLTGKGILPPPPPPPSTAPEIVVEQPEFNGLADNNTAVNFGALSIGVSGDIKMFTIRNAGNQELAGIIVSADGNHPQDFVFSNPDTFSVASGSSVAFTVVFKPLAEGIRDAVLRIASNDADENPFDVPLIGTGISPPLPPPPPPLAPEIAIEQPRGSSLVDGRSKKSFGSVTVGSRGLTRIFTIKNLGKANLTGLAVRKDGINSKDFMVSPPAKNRLAPGASTTFSVRFKPVAKGIRNAAIHIRSNDETENPFDVKVAGMGVVR